MSVISLICSATTPIRFASQLADGITMDKEPLFELEGMKWPVADAAAKPAATN